MTNRGLADFARLRYALQGDDLRVVREVLSGPLKASRALAAPLPLGGLSILDLAACRRQPDIVQCILNAVDWPSEAVDDALREACCYAGRRTVMLLLKGGASPHAPDESGHTAFHRAAIAGRVDVLELLAAEGGEYANKTLVPSPLTCALLYGRHEVIDTPLKDNLDFDPFAALLLRDRVRLERLLKSQAGIDQIPMHGHIWGLVRGPRPLNVAVLTGTPEFVECLLRMGVDPSTRSENGLSSLCLVGMSLACGSDPEIHSRGGWFGPGDTESRTRVLQLLTDARAERDLASLAALDDLHGIRSRLRSCSPTCADVGAALGVATYMGNLRIVQAITDMATGCGAAPFRPTPLALSITNEKLVITELLLSAGADPDDAEAFVGLMWRDDLARLQRMLKAGADPNYHVGGNFLIHEACENVAVDCITALVEAGASVSSVEDSDYGFSPLHMLALGVLLSGRNSRLGTAVNALRRAGADPEARDTIFHATPVEWAESGLYRRQPGQDLIQALKD